MPQENLQKEKAGAPSILPSGRKRECTTEAPPVMSLHKKMQGQPTHVFSRKHSRPLWSLRKDSQISVNKEHSPITLQMHVPMLCMLNLPLRNSDLRS